MAILRQSLSVGRLKKFVVADVPLASCVLLNRIDAVAENHCEVGIYISHVNELDTN